MDVDKATKELRSTTLEAIERTTALTWGARAAASYRLSLAEKTAKKRFRRFYEGENFRQEAFEHASMADEDGRLLREVRDEVEESRSEALAGLESLAVAT
ncbi:MAG: hypothetical protein HYT80_09295 [Euryarchaeota archaeon]|nr:hypothetical protein [Euryarchaeota archaeon]